MRSARSANDVASSCRAEQLGGLRDGPCAAVEAGRGHHAVVGLGADRVVRRCLRVEPVAELEALVPQAGRRQQRLDAPHVRDHRVVLRLEHGPVAVGLPQRPRNPHRRVAPDRGGLDAGKSFGGRVLQHVGDDERHHPVGGALLERRRRPASRAGSRPRRRGRPRSARRPRCRRSSRAVRRAAGQSVGTSRKLPRMPPDDVAVQLVQHRVGALEVAGAAQVGVHDHGLEVVGGELARPAVDLGVAEAVEGEGGLEDVVATAEHEAVGRLGGAQRPDAELVVLEHLGVPHGDLLTRLAAHPRSAASRPGSARSRRGCVRTGEVQISDRAQRLLPGHGGSDVRREQAACRTRSASTPTQPAGVAPGRVQAVVVTPRVDRLAVVEVVGDGRPRGRRSRCRR